MITTPEPDNRAFGIQDLCYEIECMEPTIREFLYILDFRVHVDSRNMGLSTKWLKEFCDSYDDKIILTFSGVSVDEYPTEPTEDEYRDILNRLNKFYTKVGFVSVNDYIGGYEYKESFIYKNTASEELLKIIESKIKK